MEEVIKLNDAVFEVPSRYCDNLLTIKNKLQKLMNSSKYNDLINLFFGVDNSFFTRFKIQISGDKPSSEFNFVYNALNEKEFQGMPLFVTMSQCAEFADLYNNDFSIDRSNFAAKAFSLNIGDFVLPFFILLVEYGYPYFPKVPTRLTIENGIIRIIFSLLKPFITPYSMDQSRVFKFLIDELKLADTKEVIDILRDKLSYKVIDNCLLVSYQFFKSKNFERTSRIMKFIYAKQKVNSTEVAEYFGISKRTANYILTDLVKQNLIIREGTQNSSLTRYRVNEKEYFNIID